MTGTGRWVYAYTPRRRPRIAVIAAVVVLIIHAVFASLLTISDTGLSNIGAADKIALMLIGWVIALAIMLITRSRVRVGPEGVGVRNLWGERIFPWARVVGLTYPDKGLSARLLLPDDEHVPVLAIAASDGERAVEAMSRFREIESRYRTG